MTNSSTQRLERDVDKLRSEQEAHRDNYTILMNQIRDLHDKRNRVRQDFDKRMGRVDQSLARAQQKFDREQKEFEGIERKFKKMEQEYQKAREKLQEAEHEFKDAQEKHTRGEHDVDNVINLEEERLNKQIDLKERDAESHRIKAENARRDLELKHRQLDQIRREEEDRHRAERSRDANVVQFSDYHRRRR